jgi:hypothetical protein
MKSSLAPLLTALILLTATCHSASAQATQAANPQTNKVPEVYLPDLTRPPLSLNLKALESFGTGRLPSFDGATFQVNLRGAEPVKDFETARRLIGELFSKAGLQVDMTSLEAAEKPVVNGGMREDKRLREFQEPYEKIFRDQVNRKVGKLSKGTIEAMRQENNAMAEQARQKSTVFPFHQTYKSVLVENSQVAYVSREKGINSINGNVFTQINLTNTERLSEADATDAAVKHVSAQARLKTEPRNMKPQRVILPYAEGFKYAWKLTLEAEDGPYLIWIDAETGNVLQLLPQFWHDSARGLAVNQDPGVGTTEIAFEVDPPAGGNYSLKLAGELSVTNNGADGVTNTNLTIPDAGTGEANFNVAPINGTAVERTSTAGYNSRFQEVNAFAWLYHLRKLALLFGSQPLPAFSATVNTPGDNAWASGSFEIGSATTSASTTCNPNGFTVSMFNSANDATVLAHEYGHNVNSLQYGVGGGAMTGSINEGIADFWSATIHNNPVFAQWWGHNCAATTQTGFAPRQCDPADVFPEHRTLGAAALFAESHADGQIICWALWNMRREFLEEGALGVLATNVTLMNAMTTAGLGIASGISDQRVHDSFVDLERQLVTTNGTTWTTVKILSSFARAGLFLSDKEAVIDIDDDYLNRTSATPPTFTIWTGRDYTFSASTAVTTGTLPFNTHFTVEVASDSSFTTNYFASGLQAGVTAGAGGTATWQLTTPMWDALKTGNKLYYRVTTEDDAKGNTRSSSSTGDGTISGLAVPFAVINNSGECECSCSSGATIAAISGETQGTAAPFLFAIPFLYGAYRMTKSRKNGGSK